MVVPIKKYTYKGQPVDFSAAGTADAKISCGCRSINLF